MLKPYRLLSFDPEKGKALHFIRRCLRNLAINHYNKLKRGARGDVPLSSFGPKHTFGDTGGNGSGIPDSDKAVLSVADDVQESYSALQAVLDKCMGYARKRFAACSADYNLFCAVLAECLRYGASFDSMEMLGYLSERYGVPKRKAKYICKVAQIMLNCAALDLGVIRGDCVMIDDNDLVGVLGEFYPNNLFSEVAVLLGPSVCSKLITVFGGSTLRVPTGAELNKSIVEHIIYTELLPIADKRGRKERAQELAVRFGMSRKFVMAKYRAVKARFAQAKGGSAKT